MHLPAAAAVCMVFLAGCAQNRVNGPVSESLNEPPRSEGFVAAGKYRTLTIADMNNDGRPDVVGGTASPGFVTISFGYGSDEISEPQMLPVEGDVNSVAAADINEDGLMDVVYSVRRQSSGVRIFFNEGKNRWRHTKGPIDVNNYQGVKTADINGDGHQDIIAANATSESQGGIQVWYGDGKGRWYGQEGPTVTGIYMDALPVDVNRDGFMDIIGAGWGIRGALRLWLGDGTGNWTTTPDLLEGSFYGLSTGDLNGDGHLDILAGSYRTGVKLLVGDGAAHFSPVRSPAEELERRRDVHGGAAGEDIDADQPAGDNSSYWHALAVDIDRDGVMDVVASSLDNGGIRAWLSRDHNSWRPVGGLFPRSGNYYTLARADLNADGIVDICAASFSEGIKIWSGVQSKVITATKSKEIQTRRPTGRTRIEEVRENNVFKTVDGVPEYKIGPGDLLEITKWDSSSSKKEKVRVRPDGNISYGLVEDLKVNGMTASEIDKALTGQLQRYVKRPRIDVSVLEYKSKFVRIMGAVVHDGTARTGAGKYRLDGKTTVLEMITQAGGPQPDADLKSVRVRRKSGQTMALNLYQAIIRGDASQDIVLDNDDLIYLPNLSKDGNRVYVFGEVEKPGAYTFAGSEMHLLDAIAEAGGATAFAKASDTRVVRGDPSKPEILSANLTRLLEKGDRSQNVVLASGDLIYVPRSGLGDVNLFSERIRPLLELLIWPARLVNDWDRALDVTGLRTID